MPDALHRVVIVALPTVVPFDLGVPVQVFGYPRPDVGRRRYLTTVCGVRAGQVPTSGGFPIVVRHGIGSLRRADTIVIPGVDDTSLPVPPGVLAALRAAHHRGARLVAICTGAFVLAEAGLLEGRRATTHWLDAPDLANRHPGIALDPNVLYVDEGRILTSAGICAGIDLCLHIVRQDHGAAVANAVARRLVVPPHRSGGQAQFIPQPVPEATGSPLEPTLRWARSRIGSPLTIAQLAARAGLSPRTLIRRFRLETGLPPLRWLLRQRLLAAQTLLETTSLSVGSVAHQSGFGTAISLRVHFRRAFGTSPLAYRRSFRHPE